MALEPASYTPLHYYLRLRSTKRKKHNRQEEKLQLIKKNSLDATGIDKQKLDAKDLRLQTKIQRRKFKPESRTGSIAGYSQFE